MVPKGLTLKMCIGGSDNYFKTLKVNIEDKILKPEKYQLNEEQNYALNPFNMTWEDGGRYAILGPSGCGKTTMLNIMSGIVQPSEVKLLFD